MDKVEKQQIKLAVDEHISKQLTRSSFSTEILEKVEQRIQNRIVYYEELFKNDPIAKELAVVFDERERAMLVTYEKYQNDNPKKQEYKINSFLRKRERIIRDFHGKLSDEIIKDRYLQDMVDNPKKYMLAPNKRKVIKDWAKYFPEMGIFSVKDMDLFKIVGPLILGVGLAVKSYSPDKYEPAMYIDHLLESQISPKFVFGGGVVFANVPSIELADHNEGLYLDLIDIVKDQFWLPLEGDITLEEICKVPDQVYPSFPKTYALICAWAGEHKMAQKYYEETLDKFKKLEKEMQESYAFTENGGEKAGGKWVECSLFIKNGSYHDNPELRKKAVMLDDEKDGYYITGTRRSGDVAFWEKTFTEQVKNPEKLRQIVKDNIKNNGLEKIPYQDIVGVNYKEK